MLYAILDEVMQEGEPVGDEDKVHVQKCECGRAGMHDVQPRRLTRWSSHRAQLSTPSKVDWKLSDARCRPHKLPLPLAFTLISLHFVSAYVRVALHPFMPRWRSWFATVRSCLLIPSDHPRCVVLYLCAGAGKRIKLLRCIVLARLQWY